MGGLVVSHTVLRNQAIWQGMLLSSALVDIEWTPVLRWVEVVVFKLLLCALVLMLLLCTSGTVQSCWRRSGCKRVLSTFCPG